MGLTGSRRSLHQNGIVMLDALGNVELFFICLFGKKNIDALPADCGKAFFNRRFTDVFRNVYRTT